MNSALIFALVRISIPVVCFFIWPFFIRKIMKNKNLTSEELNQMIRLRWRYGLWFVMILLVFQFF